MQDQVDTAKNPDEQKLAQQALSNVLNQRSTLNAKVKTNQTNDAADFLRTISNPKSSSADVAEATAELNKLPEAVKAAGRTLINNENTFNENKIIQQQQAFLKQAQSIIRDGVENDNNVGIDAMLKKQMSLV